MRVLILSPGQDTGGMGIRIKRAFAKCEPSWTVRAVRGSDTYLNFPGDLSAERVPQRQIQELYLQSDVVHCSNNLWWWNRLVRQTRVRKPVVITYQGTAFRTQPEAHIAEARAVGAIQMTSTIDLLTLFDDPEEGRWAPHPVPVEEYAALRANAERLENRVLAYHSPTNRRVKGTGHFIEACERLKEERRDFAWAIGEGLPWTRNLRDKAKADIVYDQMILGWGTNAVEAWAMGIPVIAATEFDYVQALMEDIIGEDRTPGYRATPETLHGALTELVEDADLRAYWGERGLDYVRRFHSEPVAVARLAAVYREAAGVPATT